MTQALSFRIGTTLFALIALLLAGLAAAPAPAQGFDPAAMTDAQRDAFDLAVRDYLLKNPEVLLEAMQVLEQRQAADQASADAAIIKDNAAAIFEDGVSWVGGNPEGDVTMVEFLDYKCAYCRKAYAEVEELVRSDGNIRFVVKEFPILGAQSVMASRYAIAVQKEAGPEAYKKAHDALMTLRGDVTPEALERLSAELGIDHAAVSARMDTPEVSKVIADNQALGQTLQINGTPTFVFGQMMLRGYVPLEGMRQVVTQERKGG